MDYDVVIVGGGIAGLTSAAFLSKDGYKVLVCEKAHKLGGLVNSFDYKGFTFDGGIRAIENSGIVFPMLRQLGLEIAFIKNAVSIGIEQDVLILQSKDSLEAYQALLNRQFPDNLADIEHIISEIKKIMHYMDILYGIDNPLFLDLKKDQEYLYKTILPWLFKYLLTINKIIKLNTPIEEYLLKFSNNQVLLDIIAQHFFQKTPAFFALSYFSLYLDYQYPKGGTGSLIEQMEKFILDNKGELQTDTEIIKINPQLKQLTDASGNIYGYQKLIWAADLKTLYKKMDITDLSNKIVQAKVQTKQAELADKVGGDSILTLFVTVDLAKSYFEEICSAHFFYTPAKVGLSTLKIADLQTNETKLTKFSYTDNKAAIIAWVKKYYALTTYEISCPVMRDETLAPPGKTGLIISTLMEYSLVKHIADMGWYEEFKELSQDWMIDILTRSIFPELKANIIDQFSATPLSLEKLTGNSDGAITGWAFTNSFIPAVSKLPSIAKSILTPIPDIYQAGQWTFSPSGLPISVLTGKLAADKIKKQLK
ncbi:MAG: NAD(P)/FAD-dependent oxidoreductase [Clostridia bacterium]